MRLKTWLAAALLPWLALAPARAADEHAVLAIPGTNVLFLVQYVAADEHLWAKQGLDVTVAYITGIGAMNAVISGSADFSMASGPSITRANARGQKLTALATANDQSGPGHRHPQGHRRGRAFRSDRAALGARQDPQGPHLRGGAAPPPFPTSSSR